MICLNGEKGLFEECLANLKKLYSDGKLNDWKIIAAEVPLFIPSGEWTTAHPKIDRFVVEESP